MLTDTNTWSLISTDTDADTWNFRWIDTNTGTDTYYFNYLFILGGEGGKRHRVLAQLAARLKKMKIAYTSKYLKGQ